MLSLILIAVAAGRAVAQQTLYGQCGGTGWTGATTCVSGAVCTYSNAYYSQCLPGTASSVTTSATKASSTTLATSTKTTTTSAAATTTAASGTSKWTYLISFGDSYSQNGFDITGTKPSASNPIGNPTFPGYTTTNGDNWIDFLITTPSTSILAYDFASGGATTDAALVTPYATTVLSLVDQVSLFSANLASKPSYCPWTSSNALFAIWIGVNDVGNVWSSSNWTALSATIIARYISQAQILYNAGARDFLFLTVPPIQKTPLVVAEGTTIATEEGAGVASYNSQLIAAIATFKAANSGTVTYVADTTVPFNTAINNPTAYGSPDATCYNSDGVSCLWYNNYHPGQAIHKLVAQAVATLIGV